MVMRSIRKGASRLTGMHGTFSGKKVPTPTSDGKDELPLESNQISKKDTSQLKDPSSLTNKTVANDTVNRLEEAAANIHKEEHKVWNSSKPATYSSSNSVGISNETQSDSDLTTPHKTTGNSVSIDPKKNDVKDTITDMPSSTPNHSTGDNVVWNNKTSILFLVVGVLLGMTSTLLIVNRTTTFSGDVSVNARSNTDDDEQDNAATDYRAIHKWIQQYEKAYETFSSSSSSLVSLSSHDHHDTTAGRYKKNNTSSDKETSIRELEKTFETMFAPDATLNYELIGGMIGEGSLQDTLQFLRDYDTIRYMYGWFFFPPWQHSLASNIHDCQVEIIEETIVQQPHPHLRGDNDGEDDKIYIMTDHDKDDGNTTTTSTTIPHDPPPMPPATKVVKAFVHGTFFHPIGISLPEYNDYVMDVDLFPEMTLIVKGSFTHHLEKVPSDNDDDDDDTFTSSWKSVYTEESIDCYKQIIAGIIFGMSILLLGVGKLVSFFVTWCVWMLRPILGGRRKTQEEHRANSWNEMEHKQESKKSQ